MAEVELVGDALLAQPDDGDFDVQHVLELDGPLIVAARGDARKRDRALFVGEHDAQAQVPQQLVLGLFHEDEEDREVGHAGRVGIAKLDAARGFVVLRP